MKLGYGRPLCCFCWLFVAGAAAVLFCPQLPVALLLMIGGGTLSAALLLLSFCRVCRRERRYVARLRYVAFLLLALFLAGAVGGAHQAVDNRRTQVYAGTEQIIHATVLEKEYSSLHMAGYTVRIEQIGADARRIKAHLHCEFSAGLQVGDRVVLQADVRDPVKEADAQARLASGCSLLLKVTHADAITQHAAGGGVKDPLLALRLGAMRLRDTLSYRPRGGVGSDAGDLCAALLLGDRAALDPQITLQFRRSGVSHLLALSGMHLGVIMAVVSVLLARLRLPKGVYRLLLCLCCAFYVVLTGCATSTLRAAAMLLYLQWSAHRGREADGLTSLSLFFAACIAWEPYMLFDVSLWMTSLAAAVPVAILPALQAKQEGGTTSPLRRCLQALWTPIAVSLLCTLALILPMWLSFGEISLISPISTLLFTLPVTALLSLGVLWLCLAGLGAGVIVTFWQDVLLWGMRLLSQSLVSGAAALSSLPSPVLSLRYATLDVVLPACFVLLLCLLLGRCSRRAVGVMLSLSLLLGVGAVGVEAWRQRDAFALRYVTAGESELLLVSYGRQNVLCDLSDGSYRAYAATLKEGLAGGATELDALLLTHYHGKHVSMLEELTDTICLQSLYLPIVFDRESEKAAADEGIARKLQEVARQKGVDVVFYEPMRALPLTDGIRLLGLQESALARSAHPVLVLSLGCADGRSVTYAGGAFAEQQESLAFARDCIRASEAVILGRHGPLCKEDYTLDAFDDTLQYAVLRGDGAGAHLLPGEEAAEAFGDAVCYAVTKQDEAQALYLALQKSESAGNSVKHGGQE